MMHFYLIKTKGKLIRTQIQRRRKLWGMKHWYQWKKTSREGNKKKTTDLIHLVKLCISQRISATQFWNYVWLISTHTTLLCPGVWGCMWLQKSLLEMFAFLSCVMKISLHHAAEFSVAKERWQKRKKRNSQMEKSNVLQ